MPAISPLVILIILAVVWLLLASWLLYYVLRRKTSKPEKGTIQMPSSENRAIFVDLSPKSADIVELAVEVWRMNNRVLKAAGGLSDIQKRGFESSLQKFGKFLDRYEVKIVDHTGEKYNEGMNLDVLSFENDPSVQFAMIKETIEPSITCKGHLIKKGKVIVANH